MAHPVARRARRTRRARRVAAGTAALVLAAGLAGCGGDDDADAGSPADATVTDFCRALEDAPGAEASADDYHDYAGSLSDTGTPVQIEGPAREGFEVFVDYLADVDDDDVAVVKGSDEPTDVFSGAEADKVESFKQGYLGACVAAPATDPSASATPGASPTGGVLPGLSDPGAASPAP